MVQPYLDANEGISLFGREYHGTQRMIVLYDQSAVFGGLVIGTSNKTEILLLFNIWEIRPAR
jgi:NAD+ synthase